MFRVEGKDVEERKEFFESRGKIEQAREKRRRKSMV